MMNPNGNEMIPNFKLLLIGDSSVGKSSLLMRYINDSFECRQAATIGVDFKVKIATVPDGSRIKLSIWDTAGQERFRTLTPNVYRGSHGAIIVFDVCNRESFDNLPNWLDELKAYSDYSQMVKTLVGNKIDYESREITKEEGIRFARLYNMPYMEASAKTSEGVNQLFQEVVTRIYSTPDLWNRDERSRTGLTKTGSYLYLNSGSNDGFQSKCCR